MHFLGEKKGSHTLRKNADFDKNQMFTVDWTNLITDLVNFELEIFKKPVFDKYSLAW